MYIQLTVFSEPKAGNAPEEWEDAALAGVAAQPARFGQLPSRVRYVVADGATGGYVSRQWVSQLVTWFAPADAPDRGPRFEHASMRRWFERMQEVWAANPPPTLDVIDEIKAREDGSFATLLGFDLLGLDGPEPAWQAVSLGDTVLFHVRAGQLQTVFPPLGSGDFDAHPGGVHSMPAALDWMSERLLIGDGDLAPGDFLFAATDAMAHWIIQAVERDEEKTWTTLSELIHPAAFNRFVREQRGAGNPAETMKNDDVTLMRLRMLADPPSYLLVCL
jgi:hypothetical protein